MRATGSAATTSRGPFGLPRGLWLVQVGIFLNYLGWGAVMPFEIIYLHEVRGFDLGFAGLVVGVVTGLAVLATPLAGTAIDRVGPRLVATLGLVSLGFGYAGLGIASTPAVALVAATLAGIGNGLFQPSQSTLIVSLVSPELRSRASGVSRVASNLGVGIGGVVGGLVVTGGVEGFVALFFLNAATYLVYAGIIRLGVREPARSDQPGVGYRAVLGDRALLRLALTNTAVIGVGWGFFSWVVPVYVSTGLGLPSPVIGAMVLVNAATVVILQLPVTRQAEGRRRAATIAAAGLLIAVACLLVLAAGLFSPFFATVAVVVATGVVGLAECVHTSVLMPLTADLAPDGLRGRYMATTNLSWWLGLTLAPILGAPLMGVSPPLAVLTAALIAAGAAVSAASLDAVLPPTARRSPRTVSPTAVTGEGGGVS